MKPPVGLLFVPFLLSGCGDDAPPGGANTGGAAGLAGSGGDGGTGATGGTGGSDGTGASGGSGGTGATGGSGGTGTAGGSGGTGATGGSGGTGTTGGSGGTGGASLAGHVVYRADSSVYLIEASAGAQPTSLSDALDALSPGSDRDVNLSPDGAWLSVVTSRFGCDDWDCAVVLDVGLSQSSVLKTAGGEAVHPNDAVAVGSGGDVVVFPDSGSHERDLFVMRKSGSAWTNPMNITGASPFTYNTQPAIADDGHSVVFDCSPVPYGGNGTRVCEVNIDGSGLQVRVDPSISPNGQSGFRAHSPDYAPDGSIVFEAEWGQEQIWRLSPGSSTPTLIGSFGNDNTPCVLPDGRVVSLWLNAPNNPGGNHELKAMSADGTEYIMLLQGIDVHDSTIGCGL